MRPHAPRGLVALLLVATIGCGPARPTGGPSAKPPEDDTRPALAPAKQGAFVTGQYRNLFVEMGKPKEQVEAKIHDAYQQLFHGDPSNSALMFDAGSDANGPLAYIMDIGNGDVRSEGMSYGMMIAVQLDQRRDFDALWNWVMTHMAHPSPAHPVHGYFSWQMRPDGSAMDEMPAADGEEYFATALLFAAHRWGSREGIYDYAAQARRLLHDMKNRAAITGTVNGDRKTSAVALFHPEHKMVRFTPDTGNFEKNGDHTNPSYHLPAFYELWALWGPEADRAFWAEAAHVSRDFLAKATHPKTALGPDYANFDGSAKAASWDPNTVQFRYDAWRTAMNWAVDAAWWAKDPRENERSDRLLEFFAGHGKSYPNTFQIDGTPTSQSSSLGLIATNAAAALAATHPRAFGFVEDLYQRPVPNGKWRYYDGMLYMMAMMHIGGQFRIHAPPS